LSYIDVRENNDDEHVQDEVPDERHQKMISVDALLAERFLVMNC
jgi:hypothetical protein